MVAHTLRGKEHHADGLAVIFRRPVCLPDRSSCGWIRISFLILVHCAFSSKCQFYKTGLHLFDHCLSGYFETNFSQSFRFSMYEKKNLPQSEHFLWISKYLISLPFGPCVQCQQITSLFLCLQNNFLIKFIADLLNLNFLVCILLRKMDTLITLKEFPLSFSFQILCT